MGKNPIKILGIVNLILLVGLIVVIVFVKQKQKDGKIGYFFKKDEEEIETIPYKPVGPVPSPAPPRQQFGIK
ncbi:MAG: hypothetical protein HYU67_04610 [Flavobacteriia bacterium]|nr:hypothetical protein [Flavobacteriia bacterium]